MFADGDNTSILSEAAAQDSNYYGPGREAANDGWEGLSEDSAAAWVKYNELQGRLNMGSQLGLGIEETMTPENITTILDFIRNSSLNDIIQLEKNAYNDDKIRAYDTLDGTQKYFVQSGQDLGKNDAMDLVESNKGGSKPLGSKESGGKYRLPNVGDDATNTGPRAPRVDVSDDLVPTRNPYVDVQYRYGDPDSGHGIEVTVDNGALSLDVAARGDASTLGSGTDMFNSGMLRLQRDGVEIDRIQGVWIPGTGSDNFAQFNSNIAAGMTRSEAAQNTWTGRIAASHGFTEVVETTRPGSTVIDFDFVRP